MHKKATTKRKNLLKKSKAKRSKTKNAPPFLLITAQAIAGGNVYNSVGTLVAKVTLGLAINLTGEIRDIPGIGMEDVKCHRMRPTMWDTLTEKTVENEVELWIPSNNLNNFLYPFAGVVLQEGGVNIPNTKIDDSNIASTCWEWALDGDLSTDTSRIYNKLYEEKILMIPDWGNDMVKFTENWETTLVPKASPEAKQALKNVAVSLLDDEWNENFATALMRVVVEQAGFKVVEDDRYQINMSTKSTFTNNHWDISVKMGDGRRNYIQKVANTAVQYNWDAMMNAQLQGTHQVNINVQSFKREHFEILEKAT